MPLMALISMVGRRRPKLRRGLGRRMGGHVQFGVELNAALLELFEQQVEGHNLRDRRGDPRVLVLAFQTLGLCIRRRSRRRAAYTRRPGESPGGARLRQGSTGAPARTWLSTQQACQRRHPATSGRNAREIDNRTVPRATGSKLGGGPSHFKRGPRNTQPDARCLRLRGG